MQPTTSAPYRVNETATVQALRDLQILDTEAEAEFDALAHAAAVVCDAPMALVSLVDMDRQWFKARFDFEGPMQTSRDVSFCAHAVLGDGLFIVGDASKDARFAALPAVVAEPHIRFYAGAPLQLSNGLRIGTLCVMDRDPRTLTDAQGNALTRLATAVVRALEGRHAVHRGRTPLATPGAGGASGGMPALIEHALGNVQEVLRQLMASQATERAGLFDIGTSQEPAGSSARRARQPAHRAMHFCLTSTVALLGITYRLLQPHKHLTPVERAFAWNELAEETKTAGRSAYRAALELADPHAEEGATAPANRAASLSVMGQASR